MDIMQAISQWFDRGSNENATHLIVVCDGFDYSHYPVFVNSDEDVNDTVNEYKDASMQKVMEVYNLSEDKNNQINQHRCWNI